MHEASGWNSLGAELGDGVGEEEVTPQVCWYLVLGVDLLCGTLIGCQEEQWCGCFADVVPVLGSPSIPLKQ